MGLAIFPGDVHEKMTAWCLSVLEKLLSTYSMYQLELMARQRATYIILHTREWLENKEADDELILLACNLEVLFNDCEIWIGDEQIGYLTINVCTGATSMNMISANRIIEPTYISLYKYVSWDALDKTLEKAKLKVSEPRKCNDVYEFMPAWETEKQKDEIFKIMDDLESLMLCLSRTPSSSVMWGQYATNGEGALLCFRMPVYKLIAGSNEKECMLVAASNEIELRESIDKRRPLIISQVSYAEERPEFKPKKTYYDYDQLFSRKGTDWAYEQEMRIIFNKDELGTTFEEGHYLTPVLMPYLTDIVLGQRCEKTVEQVRALIGENHDWLHNIPIHRTEYSPSSYKLQLPVPESLGIESVPLYRRMGLGIPPMNN